MLALARSVQATARGQAACYRGDERPCVMSREERTFWRHQALSLRHRAWGVNCPATDIDWLVVEYDQAEPRAVVEYKNEFAAVCYPTDPNRIAIVKLCNKAGVPYVGCRYGSDLTWYKVTPLNPLAARLLQRTMELTERQWVELLYALRGRPMPKLEIFTGLP